VPDDGRVTEALAVVTRRTGATSTTVAARSAASPAYYLGRHVSTWRDALGRGATDPVPMSVHRCGPSRSQLTPLAAAG
jgi:hypothetical protein